MEITAQSSAMDSWTVTFIIWLEKVIDSGQSLSKPSWLSNVTKKYQSLSNQSFQYNLAHVLSLNIAPKLSFEPWFLMFIINGYHTKNQTFVVLGLLIWFYFSLNRCKICSLNYPVGIRNTIQCGCKWESNKYVPF